jgi:hypothetical protein
MLLIVPAGRSSGQRPEDSGADRNDPPGKPLPLPVPKFNRTRSAQVINEFAFWEV